MKKTFSLFTAVILVFSIATGQNTKPSYGKTFPSLIKPTEVLGAYQKDFIFNAYFDMGQLDAMKHQQTYDDHIGFRHEKFQQFFNDIPVEGGVFTIHSKNGYVESLSGNFYKVDQMNCNPSLSEQNALSSALTHVGASKYAWEKDCPLHHGHDHDFNTELPTGELVIVPHPKGLVAPRLAYKFDIYAAEPLYRAWVYVDANNGEVFLENYRIHDTNVAATGDAIYNGTVNITADNTGTNYRLRQTSSGDGVETYDLNNGTNYNNATDVTSSTTHFSSDNVAVQAHWGAEQTHSYFLTKHNRNSYNGTGGKLKSYVHYSTNYVNAFWDGQRMTYGDGDGVNYGPLVSLDICGHELAHGVTEYTANLIYQNESGALNESFSDIFGESVENFGTGSNDWLMGDQIGSGGSGGAIRNMANPNAFNDPDTYFGTYWYTGSGDNGGVHTNSGVQNKWFYILTVGESGTNDNGDSYAVTGIGMDNAAEIAYRNLSVYLSTNSNYSAARTGAIQAAIDLFGAGSAEEIAVTDAWYAVGVGAAWQPPIGCVGATVDLAITLDNYPGETTWDLKDAGGTTIASGGPYSTQGGSVNETFNLTTGDYTFTIHDSYGDGICCAYGTGSYSLTSGGTTIVSGGAFGSQEATNFCVDTGGGGGDTEPPSVPGNLTASNTTTSSTDLSWTASSDNVGVDGYNVYVDGILDGSTAGLSYTVTGLAANTTYNLEVTAYDAAGNESAPASVNVTTLPGGGGGNNQIFAHYFETGWDGWADGGSDCARYSGSRSWEGSFSIRLRDDSGVASAMTSSSYDVSSYDELEIEFYFYPYSMENGEDFWVQYHDGSSWNTVASYAAGTSFNNNSFYVATVTVSSNNYSFPSNAQFRFQCDASANGDHIYIDAVTVTGISNGAFMAGTTRQSIEEIPTPGEQQQSFIGEQNAEMLIYPNPANDLLFIASELEVESATIMSMSGAVVKTVDTMDKDLSVDLDGMAPGMYLISVKTSEGRITKKFIKQ